MEIAPSIRLRTRNPRFALPVTFIVMAGPVLGRPGHQSWHPVPLLMAGTRQHNAGHDGTGQFHPGRVGRRPV